MPTTILVVEDEAAIRDMIRFSLEGAGYQVVEAESAKQAFLCVANQLPDCILLDWMLPAKSGIEIAKKLREEPLTKRIPIIMLTARAEEECKVEGLDSGADDYVVKPFSPRELNARIKALLRRRTGADDDGIISAGELQLDANKQEVKVAGELIKLSHLEFRLLQFFMTNANKVFSRAQLLDAVWGGQADITERAVDVVIRRVRKALLAAGDHIETVRGAGYRFSHYE